MLRMANDRSFLILSGQSLLQADFSGVWSDMTGVRIFWKESIKYWFSSFKKAISFFMVDVWNTNQYNKNTPATENKIENNSFWVVIAVNMEADNDVIIKYFIFICFIVTSLGETGLFLLSEFKTKNAQYYSLMIVYQ